MSQDSYEYWSDSDGYLSSDDERKYRSGNFNYDSDTDEDRDPNWYYDPSYDRKTYREIRIIETINLIIYLGPLYQRCDNRKKGVTEKELRLRLDYLKKSNLINKDCTLEEFIKICRLHRSPDKASKCFVEFMKLVKSLTIDRLQSMMLHNYITEDGFDILVNYGVILSPHILLVALRQNYSDDMIYKLIKELKNRDIFWQGSYEQINIYNKPGGIRDAMLTQILNRYYTNALPYILDYLGYKIPFYLLSEISSEQLSDYNHLKKIMDHINPDTIQNVNNVTTTVLDVLYYDVEDDQFTQYFIDFFNNLKQINSDLTDKIEGRIKEQLDDYLIQDMRMVKVIQELGFLNKDFDLEEYEEEMEPRRIQREQGIETINVHDVSTNNANNATLKVIIPNPNNERNIINLTATTEAANDFLKHLEIVNNQRLAEGKKIFQISLDDILLCQNYFYDYNDRLLGRDKTPAGEGVEVCNVFIAVWNIAKQQLNDNELIFFTERLAEEIESALSRDKEGKVNPKCATGWVTRLINSMFGTGIILPVVPKPDKEVFKEELNNFVMKKRKELEDDDKEAIAFDDSIYFIVEDGFEAVRNFIDKRMSEFVQKIHKDFKHTKIRKKEVKILAEQAKNELYTINQPLSTSELSLSVAKPVEDTVKIEQIYKSYNIPEQEEDEKKE